VVSRPRASFDAGLLLPRFVSQALAPLRMLEACAFVLVAPCDASKTARRPCIIPKGWPRPCSPLDAHVVLAFSVPALALVLRRSRSHPRSGPSVVRPILSNETSLGSLLARSRPRALSRAHLRVSAVLAFRRSRATPIGSQSTGSRARVTFRRGKGGGLFLLRTVPLASHPAITFALALRRWRLPCRTAPRFVPVLRRSRSTLFLVCTPILRRSCSRGRRTLTLAGLRGACVHLSFRTDFRSR
jgi:hypothetical protein